MKPKPRIASLLALIAIVSGAAIWAAIGANDHAEAFAISNCSGSAIRIEAFAGNRGNARRLKATLKPGTSRNIIGSASLVGLKVYEASVVNTLRISEPGLDNRGSYSTVRMTSGQWQLVQGKAC